LIERDSLVGTNRVNALNGTGVANEGLLVELPDPPPPPPLEELPDEVPRDVPLSDVVALDEVPVLVLVLDSTVELVPDVEDDESAELEFTLDAAEVVPVLPGDSADVDADADETPFVCDAVSFEELGPPEPCPAPEDDPAEFDAVAATVPVVVAWT
jgi:hypothetical protein